MLMRIFGNNIPHFLSNVLSRVNITSQTMPPIKTFVFLDLETTGLPHLEHNKTKITELCAVAVQTDHIELGCFPRVHNKLSFCLNPRKMISPESTDITGLSNDLLENQGCFTSNVVDIITKWLEMNQTPICLVAHNGNRFDYPILKSEIEKTGNCLPEDLLCVDSLQAFRCIDSRNTEEIEQEVPSELDDDCDRFLIEASQQIEQSLTPEEVQKINETTPKKQMIGSQTQAKSTVKRKLESQRKFTSYKLGDIYKRLTSKDPIRAHEAEGDVFMLITCAATYGEKFVEYAEENSVKFSEIPAMKPGKKIGM